MTQLNNTIKLYNFMLSEKQKSINEYQEIKTLYDLILINSNDNENTKALTFFNDLLQQKQIKINDDKLYSDLLYKHKKTLLYGYYNVNYSVLHNINDIIRRIKYVIKYHKDNNDYILINKKQSIFRKTEINHIIEKAYNKRLITKNSYRKYKKYGFISQEIKQRINIYLRNSLLKIGHKKHYNSLMENRKHNNTYFIDEIKLNVKFRKNINPKDFKKELLYKELHNRKINELKYNVYRK